MAFQMVVDLTGPPHSCRSRCIGPDSALFDHVFAEQREVPEVLG